MDRIEAARGTPADAEVSGIVDDATF